MSEPDTDLEARVKRLEETVLTMAVRLAQTHGVWGEQDYRCVKRLLGGDDDATASAVSTGRNT